MKQKRRAAGIHPSWWTLILVAMIIVLAAFTAVAFNRDFTSYAKVTVTSDRAGLVMEPYAMVKFRGVEVGRVASIQPDGPVRLQLEVDSGQLRYIPANVAAQITAPTVFGAKYVELLAPSDPSSKRLAAGAVLHSRNVSIEANTVLQNVVGVLSQIDTAKLNAVLSAFAEGFRGKGQALGEAVTDLNQVLIAINPRSETIRADFRAVKGFSDTYSAAAPNLLTTLDALSTTSSTISTHARELDSLLLNAIGLSNSGINLIGPNKDNLVHAINILEPTTRLLMKYNPELTCTIVGGQKVLDKYGWGDVGGLKNRRSIVLDAALLFGEDMYRYPDNLPINGIKGGPGGAPGCGSLPDVADNWPVRYLVTDSGWGTGLDLRPNPGIGFPGYADYFPVTRGTPKPPSIRHPGGPAPGPVPYPGAPPFGAPRYAPDGTPLYPGLPPAPPPGRPREPGAPPAGSEPFTPAHPGLQPTCGVVTQPCGPPSPSPLPPPPEYAPSP
ncbi:MCE family protein [uncultured Mycobacterium sp.]|uniref:MCE family protein n=1 Tax=uncultured Mycobacterium sp. TaxID=171292 RepID=UPI0035CC3C35